MRLKRLKHLPLRIQQPIFDASLQQFLSGRIWLEEQLPFLKETIRYHERNGFIDMKNGICDKQKLTCQRCLNEERRQFHFFSCSRCEKTCMYCLECIQLGRVSRCSKLVTWSQPEKERAVRNNTLVWRGQLTAKQQRVSEELIESWTQKETHLLHAVTGAGKTEILFPLIEKALEKGERVCIASPRTDVVLELFPRLQQAFATTKVQALYGGSGIEKHYAPLLIMTTHQLFRFEDAFHTLIVDEVDAFPYNVNVYLQKAVHKAKKHDSFLLWMTATPTNKQKRQFKQKGHYSFIPRRFHGGLLPVPHFESLWRYEKYIQKGTIIRKLKLWIEERRKANEPFLLFFPTIALMKKALPIIQQFCPAIEAVYSADESRHDKVNTLRNGDVQGLLTTTILERGITIPHLQVAVIGAEHIVFTREALIQISGRVGRSKEAQSGDVTFFHHGITKAMVEAKKEIMRLNEVEYDDG